MLDTTVTLIRTRVVHTRDLKRGTDRLAGDVDVEGTVTGADPLPTPYHRSGTLFQPEEWRLDYGDTPTGWACAAARVGGHVLKSDGTPGLRTAHAQWYPSRLGELPEWLAALAAEHTPTWTVRNPEETP